MLVLLNYEKIDDNYEDSCVALLWICRFSSFKIFRDRNISHDTCRPVDGKGPPKYIPEHQTPKSMFAKVSSMKRLKTCRIRPTVQIICGELELLIWLWAYTYFGYKAGCNLTLLHEMVVLFSINFFFFLDEVFFGTKGLGHGGQL